MKKRKVILSLTFLVALLLSACNKTSSSSPSSIVPSSTPSQESTSAPSSQESSSSNPSSSSDSSSSSQESSSSQGSSSSESSSSSEQSSSSEDISSSEQSQSSEQSSSSEDISSSEQSSSSEDISSSEQSSPEPSSSSTPASSSEEPPASSSSEPSQSTSTPSSDVPPEPPVTGFSNFNDDQTFEIHTAQQKTYLSYEGEYFSMPSNLYPDGLQHLSDPNPITLTWDFNAPSGKTVSNYSFTFGQEADLSDGYTINTTTKSVSFYNAYLGRNYYRLTANYSDSTNAQTDIRHFDVDGAAPRNLRIDGMTNCRDMGGRATEDGGMVKQGLIFRTSGTNGWGNNKAVIPDNITSAGREELLNHLGVKTEINVNTSGSNQVGVQNFQGCFMDYQGGKHHLSRNVEPLKKVFHVLSDPNNYPVFYHCRIGTDRTGLCAIMISGLLGIPENEIFKDYLFSNFGNIQEKRYIGNGSADDITNYINEIKAMPGDRFSNKVYNFLVSVGVPASELDSVIDILTEGNKVTGNDTDHQVVATASDFSAENITMQTCSSMVHPAKYYQLGADSSVTANLNVTTAGQYRLMAYLGSTNTSTSTYIDSSISVTLDANGLTVPHVSYKDMGFGTSSSSNGSRTYYYPLAIADVNLNVGLHHVTVAGLANSLNIGCITLLPKNVFSGSKADFHTDLQNQYLNDNWQSITTYIPTTAASGGSMGDLSAPNAISLDYSDLDNASSYYVQVAKGVNDFSGAQTYVTTTKSYQLWNAELATTYYYRAATSEGGLASATVKAVSVASLAPRNLKVGGVSNFRDVGGWSTSLVPGSKVKQGLYYRCAQLNSITSEGKAEIKRLGIKVDIDMRDSVPATSPASSSEWPVAIVNASIPSGTESTRFSGFASVYKTIFETIAEADTNPVMLHCTYGADRTGIASFYLLALIGVSKDDIARDYSFTRFAGQRDVNHTVEFDGWVSQTEALSGETFADKMYNHLLSKGISEDTLETIREKFIPGYVRSHTHNSASGTLYYNDQKHYEICDECGNPFSYADHVWEPGTVINAPTHAQTGLQEYHCVCGASKEVVVPAIGHTWTFSQTVSGGEGKVSYDKYTCSCGATKIEINALDENYALTGSFKSGKDEAAPGYMKLASNGSYITYTFNYTGSGTAKLYQRGYMDYWGGTSGSTNGSVTYATKSSSGSLSDCGCNFQINYTNSANTNTLVEVDNETKNKTMLQWLEDSAVEGVEKPRDYSSSNTSSPVMECYIGTMAITSGDNTFTYKRTTSYNLSISYFVLVFEP